MNEYRDDIVARGLDAVYSEDNGALWEIFNIRKNGWTFADDEAISIIMSSLDLQCMHTVRMCKILTSFLWAKRYNGYVVLFDKVVTEMRLRGYEEQRINKILIGLEPS